VSTNLVGVGRAASPLPAKRPSHPIHLSRNTP
jgi:hypothetical protein